jgi:hypothetical protein
MTWNKTGQTTWYFNDPFGPKVLDYFLHLEPDTPFFWMDRCTVMRPFVSDAGKEGMCFVVGKPGGKMQAALVHEQVITAEMLQKQTEQPGDSASFFKQRREVLARRIRPEVAMLVSSVPDNSVLYINDPHEDWDLQLFFQDPEIRGRGLRYTNTVPKGRPFFFVASDLVNEQKKLPDYKISFYSAPRTFREFVAGHLQDIILLAVKDEATGNLSRRTRQFLFSLGLDIDQLTYRGSFAAVLVHGRVITQQYAAGETVILKSEELRKMGIDKIVSGGALASNRAEIWYRGKDYSLNRRGFNVVVIGRNGPQVASFDTFKHEWDGYAVFRAIPVR